MMKLPRRRAYRIFYTLNFVLIGLIALLFFNQTSRPTYAEENPASLSTDSHFVTIHDQGQSLTFKTSASSVKQALDRAKFSLDEFDRVEPDLDTIINADQFHINIYRAHPVIIIDGQTKKYLMTATRDPKIIASAAEITLYDGDELKLSTPLPRLLQSGLATTYEVLRHGGETITLEQPIPFVEKTLPTDDLLVGQSKLHQPGEDGLKVLKYRVNFKDGVEVSRTLISEQVTKSAVPRITAVGTKKSIPPEWSTCAEWARAAGVSEDELPLALTIIYRESGCRVDATNASSGAYGIPQALPGNKMAAIAPDWQTNPVTQIRWMAHYVTNRYGGWAQALDWWQAHRWY